VQNIEQAPTPDLHLLRNMRHSLNSTLFLWYLIKGFMMLCKKVNDKGKKYYKKEYKVAEVKKEKVIDC